MEKRIKAIKYVELQIRIPNEVKETGIDERTAPDVRFFYLHQKEFELWNAAPDKKHLFGKTKNDLAASDPDISRVAKIFNYFGGHVPSQLALDNYNRIMEKKTAVMREDRELQERIKEYGKEIEELSTKINGLKGELLVYPDKNAEMGDFGQIKADYINYFPQDWSVEAIWHYAAQMIPKGEEKPKEQRTVKKQRQRSRGIEI